LAADFVGEFCAGSGQLRRDDLIDGNSTTIEMLQSQQLAGFEAMDMSVDRRNGLRSSVRVQAWGRLRWAFRPAVTATRPGRDDSGLGPQASSSNRTAMWVSGSVHSASASMSHALNRPFA